MKRSKLAAFLGMSLPFAVFAAEPVGTPVATLGATEGTVMVNTGERYVNAVPGQALAPGDRIMVMSGATAQIDFADGCQLPLSANTVAVVPQASTCAGAVADVHSYGPVYAQAVGSSATTSDAAPEQPRDGRCGNDYDDDGIDCPGWWIFGGIVVGYGLYEVFKDDDDERGPISE